MYGIERLCKIVSNTWENASSSTIQHTIIEDMRSYIGEQQIADDITLVVVKRLT